MAGGVLACALARRRWCAQLTAATSPNATAARAPARLSRPLPAAPLRGTTTEYWAMAAEIEYERRVHNTSVGTCKVPASRVLAAQGW